MSQVFTGDSALASLLRDKDARVITDHGSRIPFEHIRINAYSVVADNSLFARLPRAFALAVALLLQSYGRPITYLTFGNNPASYWLMLFQYVLMPIRRPRPHIMFDCLWDAGASPRRRILIAVRSFLANRVATKCIVYGRQDLRSFENTLHVRSDKLQFLHYHHTLGASVPACPPPEGDYIFSGGTAQRDYQPLIQACEHHRIPLRIATHDETTLLRARGCAYTRAFSVSHDEYVALMRNARLMVLPLAPSFRTGGHQTMLNAMYLYKPLIVYNCDSADGYVEDGVTGLVVRHGDTKGLAQAIIKLYKDANLRNRLAYSARDWVESMQLTQEAWLHRVYEIVAQCHLEAYPAPTS